MSKTHIEILDTKRVNLLTKLSQVKRCGYLVGDTALALQIGNRRSVDFDIFIQKAVDTHLRRLIRKLFHVDHFLVDTSDMVTFVTIDTIPITFVWYYYSLLFKSVKTIFFGKRS